GHVANRRGNLRAHSTSDAGHRPRRGPEQDVRRVPLMCRLRCVGQPGRWQGRSLDPAGEHSLTPGHLLEMPGESMRKKRAGARKGKDIRMECLTVCADRSVSFDKSQLKVNA